MIQYCYTFDPAAGLGWRRVDAEHVAQPGEFLTGPDPASDAQLEALWPGCTSFVLPPTSCSKLGLRRAFVELGIWPQVRDMIAHDPDMQEEWDLATELKVADPIVQKAVAGLRRLGFIATDAQVVALITRANALVA